MLSCCSRAGTIAAAAVVAALATGSRAVAPEDAASQVVPVARSTVVEKGAFGIFRALLAGETRGMQSFLTGFAVVEPGQQIHPPHQHADEEYLLLAKGDGTWSLDGKESPAHEGDLLYVAPWVMHGIKNTSDKPLTFFVVKWSGKGLPAAEKPAAGAESEKDGKGELVSSIAHRTDVAPDAGSAAFGELRNYARGAKTRNLRDLSTSVVTVTPGKELHPPHRHAEEQIFWIVGGAGTWNLDGKESPAGEGDLLYAAPFALHGIKNTGSAPLTFFLMKWNAAALPVPEQEPQKQQ